MLPLHSCFAVIRILLEYIVAMSHAIHVLDIINRNMVPRCLCLAVIILIRVEEL